jgi:hypothetical protein
MYCGNYKKATLLTDRFLDNCKHIDVVIYTQHSELLPLQHKGKSCSQSVFELLQERALRRKIIAIQGVEVACRFSDIEEGIDIGVIPYDQSQSILDYFSTSPISGLNLFNPFKKKGIETVMFSLDEVLQKFHGNALLLYNHPELNSQLVQEKMQKYCEQYSLLVEHNLNYQLMTLFTPFLFRGRGVHSFNDQKKILGWDLHGITGSFSHVVNEIRTTDLSVSSMLNALHSSNYQQKPLSLNQIFTMGTLLVKEYGAARQEMSLRRVLNKKL